LLEGGWGDGEGAGVWPFTSRHNSASSTARGIAFGLARFDILELGGRIEYTEVYLNGRLIDHCKSAVGFEDVAFTTTRVK